jgi:photosystem II stability/assembly factor-like uncharacterized protein
VPTGSEQQYRGLDAVDTRTAWVGGGAGEVLRTTDGGRSWRLAFVNGDPAAFYDCMDFFAGGRRGLALSDPVGGKFRIAATDDYGRSWHGLPNGGMPPAVAGGFAFAASARAW